MYKLHVLPFTFALLALTAHAHTSFNGNLTGRAGATGTATTYIHSDEWIWAVNLTNIKGINSILLADNAYATDGKNITLVQTVASPATQNAIFNGSFTNADVPAEWGGSIDNLGLVACKRPLYVIAITDNSAVSGLLEWQPSSRQPGSTCEELVMGASIVMEPTSSPSKPTPSSSATTTSSTVAAGLVTVILAASLAI